MYYTKWWFWSLRKRLSFSKSEQNAGISRRQNRFVEALRNPVDTKKNPELLFLHFQFVKSMNFPAMESWNKDGKLEIFQQRWNESIWNIWKDDLLQKYRCFLYIQIWTRCCSDFFFGWNKKIYVACLFRNPNNWAE